MEWNYQKVQFKDGHYLEDKTSFPVDFTSEN